MPPKTSRRRPGPEAASETIRATAVNTEPTRSAAADAVDARADAPATCPTCRAGVDNLTLEWGLSIWAGVLHTSPALWCRACDRPWLRWCTWDRRWRGGPGPVTPESLGVAS